MKNKGFTLIELMIVVAIIGVLASIALPSYQDYIAKSQVTDGISILDGARTSAEVQVIGTYGIFPADQAALVDIGIRVTGTYGNLTIANINGADGDLVYTFTSGNANIQDEKISYERRTDSSTKEVVWGCSSTLAQKYKPFGC